MKTAIEQLPPQVTGRQTDFTQKRKYESLEAAHAGFQQAAGRMLSVNIGMLMLVQAPRNLPYVITRARNWRSWLKKGS